MDFYKEYPAHIVFLRRTFAVVAGVLALPVMLVSGKTALVFTATCTASGLKPVINRCGWSRLKKPPAISTKLSFLLKKTAHSNVAVFFMRRRLHLSV